MPTILLIDSADADSAILASALRVEGFEVIVTKSTCDARAALASHPITLTIMDLMIRGQDAANGLELARELRSTHPGMRVLLTSSYHLSERQLARADCGVSGFIPKPYDLREVLDFVRAKVSSPPSTRSGRWSEPRSGIAPRHSQVEARAAASDDERLR